MNDFLKCECPHCGQSIEYPSEGTGQTVPCPTCEKLITLTIAIQKQVKEDLQINAERNEWGVLNEPQNQAVQIPAKGSIQNTEMVSIPATETKSIVFKRVCSGKEPKLPKYLHYPPEPRPQDYNSGSDYDVVAANKKWMQEVKKREAINRRLFVVHRVKFRLWNAKHNWGDDAWLPSSFPKSPLAPSDSEEVELQKAVLEKISLPTDSPPISGLERGGSKPSKLALHLAAKKGQIDLIPSHLLKVEMFMERNKDGNTLLHIAARNGTLNQIPRQFLTKETLTVRVTPHYAPDGYYFTGSGYKALTETVLHIAALYGHGNQIPEEFLTPDFLRIEAKGHGQTVLHYFAISKSLNLIPQMYASSAMWQHKDRQGMMARDIQEDFIKREEYVANVRSEPATEKQKEKLRWFGCTFGDGMTKGQASDALDKCVRDFPEKESAYYSRLATEDQLAQIRQFNKESKRIDGEPYYDFEGAWPLTYGKAKDLIQEWGWLQRTKERADDFRENLIMLVACPNSFRRFIGLTYTRVKKAAKSLDETHPGWENEKNRQEILSNKVAELNPELAARGEWPTYAL